MHRACNKDTGPQFREPFLRRAVVTIQSGNRSKLVRFQGLGFLQGLGFRVQGLGFRVQGLGFRVQLAVLLPLAEEVEGFESYWACTLSRSYSETLNSQTLRLQMRVSADYRGFFSFSGSASDVFNSFRLRTPMNLTGMPCIAGPTSGQKELGFRV